ncbi:ABC transporter permease [Mucilaginibacter puniceus]
MIKNYIKSAFRSLAKNKGFTAINILGLALGLATCLLIIFYVVDELSYDRFNEKADRIYRVNEDLKLGDSKVEYGVAMAPLAKALTSNYPDVENAARLKPTGFHVKKGIENIIENKVVYADPSIFDVFTLPILYGNKTSALTAPNTVIISASAALKYFNKLNVVGQLLHIDNNQTLQITGVIKDMPAQSHFYADFFISMVTWPDSRSNSWLQSNYNTYVLMRKGTDHKKLEAAFPQLLRKYSGQELQKAVGMDFDAFEKSGSYFRLNLLPLTDIHLHSNMTGEMGANGTTQYIYIFSAIALFILIIACVNFMNLSTARSANRAREVGVRKVLGSPRKYLIAQFLMESILITFAATLIAVIVAALLLPAFNNLADKNIIINLTTLSWLLPALLVGILVIGFLAGVYPALFLSAFQPVDVLKGKLANGFKAGGLRSFLVVFQFAVSIFLIIGTLVIYTQLKYMQNRDVGYNRDQVLVIKNIFELGNQQAKIFKQQVEQLPGVVNATLTGFLPTAGYRNTDVVFKETSKDPKKTIFPQIWSVDHNYIKTLDMKIVAGRDFSEQLATDSNAMIVNETAAKLLGFSNPLNKMLYRGNSRGTINSYTIIGVVKDFNFNSLRENVTPMVMLLGTDNGNLGIRINTAHIPALLTQIENKWKSLTPSNKFKYSFMDADFEATYRTEQRMGKLFIIFTSLAIVIACLGLFGLAAYAAEQRNKEIGIRKVLGASVANILTMLSADFIKLVFIAMLIALPLAWYVMYKWLQDFAYRVSIHWWILALAGIMALVIAFITISFQSVKAALTNPVKSLKSE